MRTSLQPASPQARILAQSFTTSTSIQAHLRARHRPREPKPSYQVNRLTAELDNPFQEGVRFVTPEDESAWQNFWVTEPDRQEKQQHKDQTSSMAAKVQYFKRNAKEVKKNPLSPYRISESDLYSLAFLGTPRPNEDLNTVPAAAPTPNAILRRVLKRNGILERAGPDAETLKLMIAQRNTLKKGHAAELMDSMKLLDSGGIVSATMDTTEFLQWRRYISNASQGLKTLDVVLSQEDALVAAYADMSGSLDTDSEALALLNNLTINLGRREKVLGRHYCFLGLSLACRVVSVSSMLRYLKIGLDQGYFISRDKEWPSEVISGVPRPAEMWKTPYATLHQALSILLALVERPTAFPTQSRSGRTLLSELFEVLTGCHREGGGRQPCFRAAIGSSVQYFPAYVQYIRLLGHLRALRLLWYEYHSKTEFHVPTYPNLGISGRTSNIKDKLFAMAVSTVPGSQAYSLVGMHGLDQPGPPDYWKHCLSELKSLRGLQRSFGYGTDTPVEGGHKLDIRSGAMEDLTSAILGDGVIREIKDAMEGPFEDSMPALQDVIWTTTTAR